jgi:hypothetical protein
MIRVPFYLAAAQWALLLVLGVLVVLMYRQLGSMLRRDGQPVQLGPAAGSRAAELPYTRASDDRECSFTPGDGTGALLAFVDPTCPACEELVTVLSAAHDAGELAGLRVLLLMSDPPAYLEISAAFRATKLEIGRPADRAALESYRATATPLLIAIDGAGLVRAAGSVLRRAEVLGFARACLLPMTPAGPPSLPVLATAGPAGTSRAGPAGTSSVPGPGHADESETIR